MLLTCGSWRVSVSTWAKICFIMPRLVPSGAVMFTWYRPVSSAGMKSLPRNMNSGTMEIMISTA